MTDPRPRRRSRRQILAALGSSSVLTGVAGCLGGDEGNPTESTSPESDRPGTTVGRTPTERGGTNTAPAGTDREESESASRGSSAPRFSAGESYAFDVTMGGSSGTVTWTVLDVDGDRVTVERETTLGGSSRSETSTADATELYDLQPNQPGGLTFPQVRTVRNLVSDHATPLLDSDEEWTATTDDAEVGSVDFEMDELTATATGTESHAGIECSTVEFRSDSVTLLEACVNGAHPFAVHVVAYDREGKEGGTVGMELTLTEYSENADVGTGGTTTEQPQETTSDQGTESGVCASLTDEGYARYDEPDSPFVATFEYPTGTDTGEGAITSGKTATEYSLTVRKLVDGQPFDVFPTQDLRGTDGPTRAQKGELEGLEVIGELSYAGEQVPLVRSEPDSADDGAEHYTNYPYFVVGLPHEGSDGKQYYRFDLRATVQFAADLEPTVCQSTWENVAEHVLNSLEPNEDTTVESA